MSTRVSELDRTSLGVDRALTAFKKEGLGHDADGQDPHLFGDLRDNGRCARAGTAAHAGGDKDHIGTLQIMHDLLAALFRRTTADFGIRARAETARDLLADLDLLIGFGEVQDMAVGVDRDKLHALQTGLDHSVHGVVARGAADADDLDLRRLIHSKIKFQHVVFLLPDETISAYCGEKARFIFFFRTARAIFSWTRSAYIYNQRRRERRHKPRS